MTDDPFRILLVEDNSADVYLLRKALLDAGLTFELTVIEDGGGAMAFVRGEGEHDGIPVPDLAVVDLSLPKDDGVQVVQAIRQAERFADMPVVVVSSSPSPPARLEEAHLRAVSFITKPPDLDGFLRIGAVLKEILNQSQSRRAGR